MADVIALGQVSERLDEGQTVIGDYFAECIPLAEYVFEYIVFPVSARSVRYLGKWVSEQRPCTRYLKPPDFGRCIVSMYIFANKGAGVATTGGMSMLGVWRS